MATHRIIFFISLAFLLFVGCGGGGYSYETLGQLCAASDTLCDPVIIPPDTVRSIVEVPVYYPYCYPVGDFAPVLFDPSETAIAGDMRSLLADVARIIKSCELSVLLVGHADERLGTDYNYGLALARAEAVKAFLIDCGVEGDSVRVESQGEESPTAACHEEECWKLNRRVEVRIGGY